MYLYIDVIATGDKSLSIHLWEEEEEKIDR